MNQELKKAVAEHIYHSVTDGKDPEKAAELAIETMGEYLLAEVKAVRDAVARHPDVMECSEYSDDEPVSCGWKRAYEDVVWALNGGKQ